MIDVQKFIDGVAEAFPSGVTQDEVRSNAQNVLAAFLADVNSALADVNNAKESAKASDKLKIRQLLSEAKSGQQFRP